MHVKPNVVNLQPNLFKFATSELSQDAFICWLLQWAASEFKDVDPKLNECSMEFVDALFLKAGKAKPDAIDSIKVNKQINSIDVLVIIKEASGNTYAIIIEDKTDTKHHSGQLKRYYKIVRDKFKINENNIIPIYLKTGDQSSYSDVNSYGFFEFLRSDFLYILRKGKATGVDNDIFNDFLDHLESIEQSVNRYKNEPIEKWADSRSSRVWAGFFIELKKNVGSGGWGYVPNPSGGFMCFSWYSKAVGNVIPYLLLAENQLCFKIKVTGSNPTKVRNEWQKRICKAAKELPSDLTITKPDRFGSGKNMTVAVLKSGYLQADDNNMVDIPKTINVLKKCETILDAAISGLDLTP